MGSCKRAKLAFQAFRSCFTSTIVPKSPTQDSPLRIYHSVRSSISAANGSKFPGFFPYYSVSRRLGQPFLTSGYGHRLCSNGAKRFYYVDRREIRHFRQRGPRSWFQNPRVLFVVVVVGAGVGVTVYFGNLETVPYTKRRHWVLLSKSLEKELGNTTFKQVKQQYKGKILPSIHPDSIRVRLIAKQIIDALERGLSHEHAWGDLEYGDLQGTVGTREGSRPGAFTALSEGEETGDKWSKDDEILDDKWVQKSRKKGEEKGVHPSTSHLEGLNWEVLAVDEPILNAFCAPGGKIVVFTGLFKHFSTDAEIATVIGHEVAHAVARHSAEQMSKSLWLFIVQLILYQFVMPDIVNAMSTLLLRLPFSRKMELEADYIGLLLIASAGFDPRVAPLVYEKLGKVSGVGNSVLSDYLATHPSGRKRAQQLAKSGVMEEALQIYSEAISGRGVEGFL